MWLQTHCDLKFDINHPTPFLFMLRARSGQQQWVAEESYQLFPAIPVVEISDKYGNLCQRLIAPAGKFHVSTRATIRTADASDENMEAKFIQVQHLPDDVLEYLLPSRYCESDRLNERAISIVGSAPMGYQQLSIIRDWVREHISYEPGSSNNPTSALQTIERKVGVCRDLAHVGISLCRSICIPARYVVGYLHELEPMDIHAWFEAYVGDRWYTFDATQNSLKGGRIVLAYGRDAADVAISNQFGPPVFPYHMEIKVNRISDFKGESG